MRDILMLIWGAATASCWWSMVVFPLTRQEMFWLGMISSLGILALIIIRAVEEEIGNGLL